MAASSSVFSLSVRSPRTSIAFSAPLGCKDCQFRPISGVNDIGRERRTPSSMGTEKKSTPTFAAISLPPGMPGR